jgi:hypothetical protein
MLDIFYSIEVALPVRWRSAEDWAILWHKLKNLQRVLQPPWRFHMTIF